MCEYQWITYHCFYKNGESGIPLDLCANTHVSRVGMTSSSDVDLLSQLGEALFVRVAKARFGCVYGHLMRSESAGLEVGWNHIVRGWMGFGVMAEIHRDRAVANLGSPEVAGRRRWYAVCTLSQHEKSIVKQLETREVTSFLPVYESVRVWKNRQRKKIVLPLFPTYLFVQINSSERSKVLQTPGVVRMVGNSREAVALEDTEIEFLRSASRHWLIEPYSELVLGEKVRIRRGVMEGIEGTLVRKSQNAQFVLTIGLINQHAAIYVNAEDIEPAIA